MDVHKTKTPTSYSPASIASPDKPSARKGIFSGKETTSYNPFRVILNGLRWVGEMIGRFFASIRERRCSHCEVNENVSIDGSQQRLSEEPVAPGRIDSTEQESRQLESAARQTLDAAALCEHPVLIKAETKSVDPEHSDDQPASLPETDLPERTHSIGDDMLSEQESADSVDSYENDCVKIADPYRKPDDLENHLMNWSERLSLESSEEEWKRFHDEISEQCQLLLIDLEHRENIPASWPLVVIKKNDKVNLPYQYYAQLQLVLHTFPQHDDTINRQFKAMHPDNHFALMCKIRGHLETISKKLNLTQRYMDAFSNNTNPVVLNIGERGFEEPGLTREDVEELQEKIGGCIIRQVLKAKEKITLDTETSLPAQFVINDLPRSDYYVIDEEGKTLALTKPPEYELVEGENEEEKQKKCNDYNVANEKKNVAVIAHIRRLASDLRVQQQVCHFLTQNPLIGLSRGIESAFIHPLFGSGFDLSGSEGFKITFGKDESSNKIKIQYELKRSNTTILNHVMGTHEKLAPLMMHTINERWQKSDLQLTISIVIDPENPDDVTTEGFTAHVEFPVD